MCAESGDIFKSNSMTNLFSNEYVCGIVLPSGKISYQISRILSQTSWVQLILPKGKTIPQTILAAK